SGDINVVNVAPTATVTFDGEGFMYEGQALNFTADASDVGSEDTLIYTWTVTQSVDDGQGGTIEQTVVAPQQGNTHFTFTPPDQGSYSVKCIVSDDDGGTVTASDDI